MARLQRRTMIHLGLGAGLLAGLAGLAVVAGRRAALGPTDAAGFRPVAWPFPGDAWPVGRAWSSDTLDVYVRLKQDLCSDCQSGVVSDEAVDRAVDIDRLDPRFQPDGPGSRIRITDLFGRARLYRHRRRNGSPRWPRASPSPTAATSWLPSSTATWPIRRCAGRRIASSNSNTVQVWLNRQLEGR